MWAFGTFGGFIDLKSGRDRLYEIKDINIK
jgi:hypothetical protein